MAPAFHFTAYPLTNPVPVMVTGRLVLPAAAVDGETQLMTGALATTSVWELETTPSKLTTVTVAVPVLRSAVGTVTVQAVVVQEDPVRVEVTPQIFHVTVDPLVNPVPAIINGDPARLPAVAVPVMPVVAGAGAMVNGEETELTPSALTTVTLAVAAVVRSEVATVTLQVVVVHTRDVRPVALPFHFTVYPLANPVPVTVNKTGVATPAVAVVAERLVMAGAALMVNGEETELTPSALTTVTLAVAAVVRSEVATVTLQVVVVHTRDVRPVALPFHFTVYPLENPVPVKVNETGVATPAVAADCDRLVMTGGALMVNAWELELTSTELTTWIEAEPAVRRSAAVTVAVMEVALTYANVASAEVAEANVHETVDSLVKLVPVMVNGRSTWPAVAEDTGERPEIVGGWRKAVIARLRLLASTEPSPVT